MEQAILNFAKQFEFEAEIINSDKLGVYKHFVVGGMGGSHLATGILKKFVPGIELYVHRDYGIPPFDDEFCKRSLFIASSYSGNTEETVDFMEEAYSKGYDVAVISTGGKLIDFAKKNNLPFIVLPDTGIQPRSALGFSAIALATMIQSFEFMRDAKSLANTLDPESIREVGKELASDLSKRVPIIYSSLSNLPITYNWKIKMNETGKVPAFYNVFPELNHNEMNGMDVKTETENLSKNFHFIFLRDEEDHQKIQKRMDITESLYQERGLSVTSLYLEGNSPLEKIFNSLLLADWTAFYIATANNIDPEQVPIIEDLKKRL